MATYTTGKIKNPNKKVEALKKATGKSSGGVNPNFKAVPKKAGGKSPGGVNKPIMKANPSK